MRNLSVLLVALGLLAAGCTDNPDDTPSDNTLLPGETLGSVNTTVFSGDIQASVATPHMTFSSGGAYTTELPFEENFTGYVLELVWASTAPANDELSLWVRDAAAGNVQDPNSFVSPTPPLLRADGPSPLRLVVPIEQLEEDVTYAALVRAANDGGAAATQAFDLHITVFDGVALDGNFTALA